jgi:LysR family transcriptional regulator (chromosome initiation inhibitor)
MLVRDLLHSGQLVNLAPLITLPVSLYWHCWNLDSDVIDRMTRALEAAAQQSLHTD